MITLPTIACAMPPPGSPMGAGSWVNSVAESAAAPLIATYLYAQTKNPYVISLYILGCCVLGFAATAMLKDRSMYDHGREYEEQEVPAQAAVRREMG